VAQELIDAAYFTGVRIATFDKIPLQAAIALIVEDQTLRRFAIASSPTRLLIISF
jgi:hypothetical protein